MPAPKKSLAATALLTDLLTGLWTTLRYTFKPSPINFFIWLRGTFPRYRYDQLMGLGWKVFIPVSIVNLLVTGLLLIVWDSVAG